MHKKWMTSQSVAVLLALSTAATADDALSRQLECWTLLNLDEGAVMTLPIGKEQFELVTMTLNGMEYAAAYVSEGLEHRWYINPEEGEEISSDYQVIVNADLTAGYYDFTGLEVGEEREAKTIFFCRFTAETRYQTSNTEAASESGALAVYMAQIRQKIERNWSAPASANAELECSVRVRQIPGGEVIGVTILSCNGDEAVRRSVEAAVHRSSPLPEPSDPSLFDRNILLNLNIRQ
jgi:hypothetical protein